MAQMPTNQMRVVTLINRRINRGNSFHLIGWFIPRAKYFKKTSSLPLNRQLSLIFNNKILQAVQMNIYQKLEE